MSRPKRKKFIWAIDAYGNAKVQASAAQLAHSLSHHSNVEIVYIHGHSGFPSKDDAAAIRLGLSEAEAKLKKILRDLKFPQKRVKILAHGSEYVRSDVKTLVSYAKKVKADAILVSTNSRIGLLRQVLGSFSETLVLDSNVPTMIVNPKAKVLSKPGTILFPTDFSNSSRKAFEQVIRFAKATRASVKIFHQFQKESQSVSKNVSYFKNDRWLEGDKLLDDDLREMKSDLLKWLAWTKKQNVKCDYVIQYGLKNIVDATVELAKKESAWMIAMATVTGPVAATFLGSNARWMVRAADCPVWVIHVQRR